MSCLFVFVTKPSSLVPGLRPHFHLYIFHTVNFLYKPKGEKNLKKKKSFVLKKKVQWIKKLQGNLFDIHLCLLAARLPMMEFLGLI